MTYKRVQKSSSWTPHSQKQTSLFGSRPFPKQTQESDSPSTPQDLEDEAFEQHKFEATGLEVKEEYGTITPQEKEHLGVLRAKINDFWVQRREQTQGQPNLLEILTNNRENPKPEPFLPIQAKLTIGEAGDKYEQEADQVAAQVVNQINTPQPQQSAKSQTVQREEMADDALREKPEAGAIKVQRDELHSEKITNSTDTGNKYSQQLQLNKAKKNVQIQLGINWVQKGTWASEDDFKKFIRWAKTSVYGYVDQKFKVDCQPNSKDAGEAFQITIDFLLYDIDHGYTIDVYGNTEGTSAMTESGGKIYEKGQAGEGKIPAVTVAHEFGHCLLAASDEYANPALPARVLSNDHSIMANYYKQGVAAAEFKVRHFKHIAETVGKQYPGYTCKIVKA